MRFDKKKWLWVVAFFVLFGAGIAGGYLIVSKRSPVQKEGESVPRSAIQIDDSAFVRIYYPVDDKLVMEDRRVRRAQEISLAEETVGEFLKGPHMEKSHVPSGARLLGVYRGGDGILYIDLSDEFRRNFQGDALAEFLLLKGLYESIISNIKGTDDVKVLIEGKELESIGGHIFALYPLKNTVSEAR